MVKRTLVLIGLFFVGNIASAKDVKCVNRAAAFPTPCQVEGEVHSWTKGSCEEDGMFESVQCRQPGGLMVVKAPVKVFMKMRAYSTIMIETGYDMGESLVALDQTVGAKAANQAFFHGGFNAAVMPNSGVKLQNCAEAVVTVEVGRGNVLPNVDGRESYTVPTVKSLVCVNR